MPWEGGGSRGSGGGGSPGVAVYTFVKSADQSVTSSTALVNESDLAVAMQAADTWVITWVLDTTFPTGGAGAGGIQLAVSVPTGATLDVTIDGTPVPDTATGVSSDGERTATSAAGLNVFEWLGSGSAGRVCITASVVGDGTHSGSIVLQFAQNVSSATPTRIRAGSSVVAVRKGSASSIPGAVQPYSVVLRPGGTPGGNVFTSWSSLYAACNGIAGGVQVTFDASLGAINIPAGTYDVDGWTWLGALDATASASTVTLADGVHLNAGTAPGLYLTVQGLIVVTGAFTSACITVPCFLLVKNEAQVESTGTAPFVQAGAGVTSLCDVQLGASVGDGTHAAFVATGGGTMQFSVFSGSMQAAAADNAGGGSTVTIDYNDASFIAAQTGTITFTLDSLAAQVSYTPGTAGNWNPAPTVVSAALDQLAAANVKKTLDPGQAAASSITIPGTAITKAKSGTVLIQGCASLATSGVATVTMQVYRDGAALAGGPVVNLGFSAALQLSMAIAWADVLPDTAAHTYTLHVAASAGTVQSVADGGSVVVAEVG